MSPKPKVLHLIDSFASGGGQQSLSILIKYLNHEDFDIHVAALHDEKNKYGEILRGYGASIHVLSSKRKNPFIFFKLCLLVMRIRPDVVHTHLVVSNIFCWVLGLVGICKRHVSHVRSENPFRFQQQKLRGLDARANRNSDAVIAVSSQIHDFLKNEQKVTAEQIQVMQNTPDVKRMREYGEESGREFRKAFGLSENEYVIGIASRLDPNKGIFELLNAYADFQKHCENSRLIIAGEGPMRKRIEEIIEEKGLRDRVCLAGFLSHLGEGVKVMPSFFYAIDVFVLPTYFEGFPVSVLEAMTAKIPVISTPVSGLDGCFVPDEEVCFVPIKHEEKLKEALVNIFKMNESELSRVTERCYEKIINSFNPEVNCERLEKIYRELIGRR